MDEYERPWAFDAVDGYQLFNVHLAGHDVLAFILANVPIMTAHVEVGAM